MSLKSRLALWAGALLSVLLGLHWVSKKRHKANYARSMYRLEESEARLDESKQVSAGLRFEAKMKKKAAMENAEAKDKELLALDAKISTRRERIDALLKKGRLL